MGGFALLFVAEYARVLFNEVVVLYYFLGSLITYFMEQKPS